LPAPAIRLLNTQMRRTLLLATTLLINGCALQLSSAENEAFPGVNPYWPAGYTETYNQVRHFARRPQPALTAEAGTVWPGAPLAVPTTLDLLKQEQATGTPAAPARPLAARAHRGGYGLCRPVEAPGGTAKAAPGVALGLCYASAAP
jgi:hypothetical protein